MSDDTGRIAMYEKRTYGSSGDDNGTDAELTRYIYSNHLQSASLELDESGDIISYEEYHPYGTTSYQATNASIKAVAKRYRYTGKERDEESGLYYHGARYYIPWLARWASTEPLNSLWYNSQNIDYENIENREDINNALQAKYPTLSPYNYCINNPIKYIDPDGKDIVVFNMKGEEINRVVSDKVFETWVTVDDLGVSYMAPMPNVIQYFNDYKGGRTPTTAEKYQKYDYIIATETFIFNYNKNNNIVPKVNGVEMCNASAKVPDLDVNDVKGIIMMETQMGTYDANPSDLNDSKKDIMQANVYFSESSNDWDDIKKQFGLTKGGGVDNPQHSIRAGIGLLFLKGLRNPNNKGYLQTEKWYGGDDWGNAIRDYNGNSKPRPAFDNKPQKEVYRDLIKQENKASKPRGTN